MNKVDKLRAEVQHIQNRCKHKFVLMAELVLRKTLVNNIFVGSTMGPTEMGTGHKNTDGTFTLKCQKCSKVLRTHIVETCPKCFSKMETSSECLNAGSREMYFGRRYVYYSIQIRSCTKCEFVVACDTWDR